MPDHPETTWTVTAPREVDLLHDRLPQWSEVLITQVHDGANQRQVSTTRAGAESLINELHGHLHINSGRSITQCVWAELDAVMDRIMAAGPDATDKDKGEAMGLARALAHLTMPYKPVVKAVREEAKRRWSDRQK